MAESPTPLRHNEPEKMDDKALAQDAEAHVAKSAAVQLVGELLQKLRTLGPSWWSVSVLRDVWPAAARMAWLKERPDLRQKITTGLTGLAPRAARNKPPEFQASLIDSVIEDGDVTLTQFEEAFEIADLAVYGPIVEFWHKFRERFPWNEDTAANQELVAWVFERLLASQTTLGGAHARKPVLTALGLRTAIPGKLWHTKLPLEVRVAIDDLRFQREKSKPGEPVHAAHDLTIATPAIIAQNLPLKELTRVLDAAERALGFPAPGTSASTTASASAGGASGSGGAPPPPSRSVGAPPPPPMSSSSSAAPAASAAGTAGAALATGGVSPPPVAAGKTDAPAAGAEEDFAFDDDDPDDTAAETDKAKRRREQAAQPAKR